MFYSVYSVLLCCSVYCFLCTVLLPPGVKPIAVNKFNNIMSPGERHHSVETRRS